MARNIEIKARLASLEAVMPRVAEMADSGPMNIVQDDTFFRCDAGRLKLREFASGLGELIFYRRANTSGPKESFYIRTHTSDPSSLRESLRLAYGIVGRVRKVRTLFLVGRTRVHLDRVHGLGDFLELEVVLGDHEESDHGIREAKELMDRLEIAPEDLLEGAYVEMMMPRSGK